MLQKRAMIFLYVFRFLPLSAECSLELADEDGNNPLHLAAKLADGTEFNSQAEQKLSDMKERVLKDFPPAANYPMKRELLAAMYLVEKGCVSVKVSGSFFMLWENWKENLVCAISLER